METRQLTSSEPPRLLTTKDVARRLNLKAKSVENWRYLGKGPEWVRVEGSVRYPEDRFEAWLAASLGRT